MIYGVGRWVNVRWTIDRDWFNRRFHRQSERMLRPCTKVCCKRDASLLLQASEVWLYVVSAGLQCFRCPLIRVFYFGVQLKTVLGERAERKRYSYVTRVVIYVHIIVLRWQATEYQENCDKKVSGSRGETTTVCHLSISSLILELISTCYWLESCSGSERAYVRIPVSLQTYNSDSGNRT